MKWEKSTSLSTWVTTRDKDLWKDFPEMMDKKTTWSERFETPKRVIEAKKLIPFKNHFDVFEEA